MKEPTEGRDKDSSVILVTGSEGLIGNALCLALARDGFVVRPFDIARSLSEDICDEEAILEAAQGCAGIINLAAVSRVVWGERDPDLCWRTNAEGVGNIVSVAKRLDVTPWVINASSREVYGEPTEFPVSDTTALNPMNIYGRSKAEGERLVQVGFAAGLAGAILRFSNVYGSVYDHHDRVVPAFARAAATGSGIEIQGAENTFDFTHLDDTVRGILSVVAMVNETNRSLPPMHFVTGKPTTLGELANLAKKHSNLDVPVHQAPARNYDVSRFFGDWTTANALLGWSPTISIDVGIERLIRDYENEAQKPQLASHPSVSNARHAV